MTKINDVVKPKVKKRKYLSKEEATSRLPAGRPAGAKNKTTIFKEVIREGFESTLEKHGMKVIEAVVSKAIGLPLTDKKGELVLDDYGNKQYVNGDMAAAKLLLDRILPTTKAIDLDDLEKAKGISISVNIDNLQAPAHLRADKGVIEGEVISESN